MLDPLNGSDRLPSHTPNFRNARSPRRSINQHSASPALPLAASILRPSQPISSRSTLSSEASPSEATSVASHSPPIRFQLPSAFSSFPHPNIALSEKAGVSPLRHSAGRHHYGFHRSRRLLRLASSFSSANLAPKQNPLAGTPNEIARHRRPNIAVAVLTLALAAPPPSPAPAIPLSTTNLANSPAASSSSS